MEAENQIKTENLPTDQQNEEKKKTSLKTLVRNANAGFYPIIILVWCQTLLLQYARAIFGSLIGSMDAADVVIVIAYVLSVIVAIKNMSDDVQTGDVITFLIIAAAYGFSCWFFMSDNMYMADCTYPFLVESLPLLFVGLIIDFDKVKNVLYWLSVVTVYAFIIYNIFMGAGEDISKYDWQEDMDSAYKLLPHILIICLYMFEKTDILNVVTSLIGGVLLVSLGTRGPVLFYLAFIAIYFVVVKRNQATFQFKAVLFGVVVVLLYNFRSFIMFLQTLFRQFGMSNRLIAKLLESEMTDSSTRDVLYDKILAAINENPIFGYGFAGDRKILDGIYTHNLFCEMWISLGVILGSIVLAIIFFVVIRGFFDGKDNYERGFVLLLALCGLAKLFLSGSFLNERMLFLLLGYCVRTIRLRKISKKEELLNNKNKSKYIIKLNRAS